MARVRGTHPETSAPIFQAPPRFLWAACQAGVRDTAASRYRLERRRTTLSRHTGRRARHGRLSRILARGRLLAALEREALVTHVGVDGDRLKIHVQDWGAYWRPLVSVTDAESSRALEQLHQAWKQYIGSRFDRSPQREYCYRYFLLLERVLAFVGR
jgi:hypothetical protein